MKSLTTKPGEFRATCNKDAWLPGTRIDVELHDDASIAELPSRWDKKLSENVFLVPCTLDTTDRAEFERHIAEAHGGGEFVYSGTGLKPFPADRRTYAPRFPIKLRKSLPKGAADGRPFKASTKAVAASVETCAACGLVAEVDGTNEAELWWTEHQRGCSIAAADRVAS